MWLEVAIMASLFAVGNILFAHFEEGTPKWRRVAKLFLFIGLTLIITEFIGRFWFYLFLAAMMVGIAVIHVWWLPKQGINGWTAEPKEKYYKLRGWNLQK